MATRAVLAPAVFPVLRGSAGVDLVSFLHDALPRLDAWRPPGTLRRQVQWMLAANGERVLALDLAPGDPLPEGETAWAFAGTTWTEGHVRGGVFVADRTAPLAWRGPPPSWGLGGEPEIAAADLGPLTLAARSWLGAPVDDEVRLVPPDPAWPARFAALRAEVQARLGPDRLGRIEHYGSTAVPGLAAKPVVDLLLEIADLPSARRAIFATFTRENEEVWADGDHLLVILRAPGTGTRAAHLHFAPAEHRIWAGVAFRDRLRADPALAARYLALKQSLAAAHPRDREAYTDGKTAFVAEAAFGGSQPEQPPG